MSISKKLFVILLIIILFSNCFLWDEEDYCTETPPYGFPVGHVEDGSFSPDGEKVVFCYQGNIYGTDTVGLYLYDVKNDSIYPLVVDLPPFDISSPNFSPDGKWIVFEHSSQIWKIKVDGDSLTQLTTTGRNFFPRWSPDGKRIAFDSNREAPNGEKVIWLMNADGTNLKRVCEWGEGERRFPSFSTGGTEILHIRYVDGPDIALMDTSGINVHTILRPSDINAFGLSHPHFSTDGKKIIFCAHREGEGRMVWVMNSGGSNPVAIAAGDMPEWVPNGNRITYSNNKVGGIWIMESNGCNKEILIDEFN